MPLGCMRRHAIIARMHAIEHAANRDMLLSGARILRDVGDEHAVSIADRGTRRHRMAVLLGRRVRERDA